MSAKCIQRCTFSITHFLDGQITCAQTGDRVAKKASWRKDSHQYSSSYQSLTGSLRNPSKTQHHCSAGASSAIIPAEKKLHIHSMSSSNASNLRAESRCRKKIARKTRFAWRIRMCNKYILSRWHFVECSGCLLLRFSRFDWG